MDPDYSHVATLYDAAPAAARALLVLPAGTLSRLSLPEVCLHDAISFAVSCRACGRRNYDVRVTALSGGAVAWLCVGCCAGSVVRFPRGPPAGRCPDTAATRLILGRGDVGPASGPIEELVVLGNVRWRGTYNVAAVSSLVFTGIRLPRGLVQALPLLRSLTVDGAAMVGSPAAALRSALAMCPLLESVTFNQWVGFSEGGKVVDDVSHSLLSLTLRDCGEHAAAHALALLPSLPCLQSLGIGGCPLPADVLLHPQPHPSLTALSVANSTVGAVFLRSMPVAFRHMVSLDISGCTLTDPEAVILPGAIDVNAKWAVMVTGRLCRSDVIVSRCGAPPTTVIHMKVKAV